MHLVTSLQLADKSCFLKLEGEGTNVETEDCLERGCCVHGALGEAASPEARYPLRFYSTKKISKVRRHLCYAG